MPPITIPPVWIYMTALDAREAGLPVPDAIPNQAVLEPNPDTFKVERTPLEERRQGQVRVTFQLLWRWTNTESLVQELKAEGVPEDTVKALATMLDDPKVDVN